MMFRRLHKLKNCLQPHFSRHQTLSAVLRSCKLEKRCYSAASVTDGQLNLTESYHHNVSTIPLLKTTLGDLIDDAAERYPDNEAIVCYNDERRFTYAEFQAQVDQLAASLLALGLQSGDRVGVWGQNHVEWVLAFYAIAKAGLIIVNINPAYKSSELEYALNKVGVKALFLMPTFKDTDYYEILREVAPELPTSKPGMLKAERVPCLKHVVMTEGPRKPGAFSFVDLLLHGGYDEHEMIKSLKHTLQCDDPVNIQFTSGTTGNPKGATLSHHNIVNNAYLMAKLLRYDQSTKICISVPLYHCFGLVLGSIASFSTFGTQVYPARGFDAESTLKAIAHERCTSMYGTPAMFIDMLNHPNFHQYGYTSLETGLMAGSPCPIEVMNQIIEKMHCKDLCIAYGLTETSPAITLTPRDAPISKRVSTVGEIYPHMEMKVVDKDGAVVPVNQPGELCCRGHCVMPYYWEDEAKTKAAIDDQGWFYSGDLAEMTEDGYFKIVGRIKDMIIRGGENIYPTEVENFLHKHPKVEDVQVVGVPDVRLGEEACAWIKLKRNIECSPEEIKAFCKGKISHYKVPRYIEFVEEFPMTVTGKVKKFTIREEMIKKLKER